jgi:Protein of unknown function (DUF1275)
VARLVPGTSLELILAVTDVRTRSEGLPAGMLPAGVGGFLDAYTFVGYNGAFATAPTGNIVLLGVDAQAGHWHQALLHIPPVGDQREDRPGSRFPQVKPPNWWRDTTWRSRGKRPSHHEVVVLAQVTTDQLTMVDGGRSAEDFVTARWWNVTDIIQSPDRFYPSRLPELLPGSWPRKKSISPSSIVTNFIIKTPSDPRVHSRNY